MQGILLEQRAMYVLHCILYRHLHDAMLCQRFFFRLFSSPLLFGMFHLESCLYSKFPPFVPEKRRQIGYLHYEMTTPMVCCSAEQADALDIYLSK